MEKWQLNYAVIFCNLYRDNFELMLDKFMRDFSVDKNTALKLIEKTEAAIKENEPRRKFVISYLHYSGQNYWKLSSMQHWKLYCQADGYGKRPSSELRDINGGWDWSHIRDSTIDGWKRMEKKLASYGFVMEKENV